jgi:hypothetical protein
MYTTVNEQGTLNNYALKRQSITQSIHCMGATADYIFQGALALAFVSFLVLTTCL